MDSKGILRWGIAWARLVAASVLVAAASATAGSFSPFYQTGFDSAGTLSRWAITSGVWQVSEQEFVGNSTGALNIATVPTYDPTDIPLDAIGGPLVLDVYFAIGSTAADARAGVVFDFTNANNFHEVTLTPTGAVQLRSRVAGTTRIVANASTTAPGARKWVHLTLMRGVQHTTVMIDGVRVFDDIPQGGLSSGDIGLLTRNTTARFDDLDARSFGAQDPYREDFDDSNATGWQPLSGAWSAASKVYANSAVVETAITQGPFEQLWDLDRAPFDPAYTLKVRMLNPYGGSGNLIGVAWVEDLSNYTEVVFSPTGDARLNRIVAGMRTTLASARYSGAGANKWFEVEIEDDANLPPELAVQRIKVNGVQLFDVAPNARSGGDLSLITHWAPGRFDDVRAAARFLRPLFEDFEDGRSIELARGPGWVIENGRVTSTAIGANDRVRLEEVYGWHELDDIEFRARMLNGFGSPGNLVGFTYGAKAQVRYEAVFSPTGVAQLRKVVRGVSTTLATARYEGGGQGEWFDAQLIQIGQRTTIKVNGATVFDDVLQPDAVGGELGFITHWARASIDDVLFARIGLTRYRATRLTDLANPFGPSSRVWALNDRGEAVGESRNPNGTHTAVLWRNGSPSPLGANDVSNARGINNKSEVVGWNVGGTAFLWKEGSLRDLGASPAASLPVSEAHDINERGQVVGASCLGGVLCPALLWEPNGTIVPLEDLPGGMVLDTALAINERSEIVGYGSDATVGHGAASWQGSAVEPLGHNRTAADINNRGQIVGEEADVQQLAGTWQQHEFAFLPLPVGQLRSFTNAINERAEIVGASDPISFDSHATLWQEGRATDLNELIACNSLPATVVLENATDINERGQIVVNAEDISVPAGSGLRAFLLTPVSALEPCN